jgi:hypothetical protein
LQREFKPKRPSSGKPKARIVGSAAVGAQCSEWRLSALSDRCCDLNEGRLREHLQTFVEVAPTGAFGPQPPFEHSAVNGSY